jgi:hypothetical protein
MYNRQLEKVEKPDLTTKLLEFLKTIDKNEEMEVKPDERFYSDNKSNINLDIEVIRDDYATDLDRQLDNIRSKYCGKIF